MSGYAAACVFNDAFAQQLENEWSCAVRVVNWGYWNVGGGTRISKAIKNLIEQRGVEPISEPEGLAALERLLESDFTQLAVTRTLKPELIETYSAKEDLISLEASSTSCIARLQAYRPTQEMPLANTSTAQLNVWIVKLLFAQMQSMGLFLYGEQYDPRLLRQQIGVQDKFERWWQ